jgi:uncharacterized protein
MSIWLALSLSGHVHHKVAREWFDRIDEPASVLFCRATQQSFLRLLTVGAVTTPYAAGPLAKSAAWDVYRSLLADDRISFRAEPQGLEQVWYELSARLTSSPGLWMDAYLAAFATTLGCKLVTLDSDFRQFSSVDLEYLAL